MWSDITDLFKSGPIPFLMTTLVTRISGLVSLILLALIEDWHEIIRPLADPPEDPFREREREREIDR